MNGVCKQGVLSELTGCSGAFASLPLPLLLDHGARKLSGVDMPALLAGEFALLAFLGAHPRAWYKARALAESVYQRTDTAGSNLVWKYVSTLRRKLDGVYPGLIEVCRRRGYRATRAISSEEIALHRPLPAPPHGDA